MSKEKMSTTLQLLLFILDNSEDIFDMTEMKIYKLIYFLEKSYFEVFSKPLIGNVMTKNHHGPVIHSLRNEKSFNLFVLISKEESKCFYTLKNRDFTLDFTENERDVLDTGLERYKRLSASQLRNLSHDEAPFLMSEFGSSIDISNIKYNEVLFREETGNEIICDLGLSQDETQTFLSNLRKRYA